MSGEYFFDFLFSDRSMIKSKFWDMIWLMRVSFKLGRHVLPYFTYLDNHADSFACVSNLSGHGVIEVHFNEDKEDNAPIFIFALTFIYVLMSMYCEKKPLAHWWVGFEAWSGGPVPARYDYHFSRRAYW